MHELGLCDGIVEAALRRADGRRVRSVTVRLGGHPVDPSVIEHGVQLAASGTVAAGMTVELVQEPMRIRCRACGSEATTDTPAPMICGSCGSFGVEAVGEEYAVLESITFSAPAPAARQEETV
jgi:hydrogenase nickel incorporation protein HypA/HybF